MLTSPVAPELLEPPVAVAVTVTEAPPLAWLLPPAVLDPFEVEVPALPVEEVEEEEDDTGAPELEVVNSGTSARHAGARPPLNTRSAKSRIRRNTRRR